MFSWQSVRSCLAIVLFGSACGPAVEDNVALREICGAEAPARVLAFPEDARPYAWSEPQAIDAERLLWPVRSLVPDGAVQEYRGGPSSVWITGKCGESPQEVDGIDDALAWIDPQLPGVLVAVVGDAYPRVAGLVVQRWGSERTQGVRHRIRAFANRFSMRSASEPAFANSFYIQFASDPGTSE